MENKILQILKKLENGFKGLDSKFEGLSGKLSDLETKFDGLETKFDGLETKFDGLETKFDGLSEQVGENTVQITQIQTTLGEVKSTLDKTSDLALKNQSDISDIKRDMLTKKDKQELMNLIEGFTKNSVTQEVEAASTRQSLKRHEVRMENIEKQIPGFIPLTA